MSNEVQFYFSRSAPENPWWVKRYGSLSDPLPYQNQPYDPNVISPVQWVEFGPWIEITKSKRKKLFEKYSKIRDPKITTTSNNFVGANFTTEENPVYKTVPQTPQMNAIPCDFIACQNVSYLGPLNIPEDMACVQSSPKKKKGNTMYYDDDECDCCENRPGLSPEKRYLVQRTNCIENDQRSKIPGTYHLEDDPTPMTANELIQRIKDGKFVVAKDKGDEQGNWPNYGTSFISWRDPAVTKDVAGADKAHGALHTAVTKTLDTIYVGDAPAALTAVQALESQTF